MENNLWKVGTCHEEVTSVVTGKTRLWSFINVKNKTDHNIVRMAGTVAHIDEQMKLAQSIAQHLNSLDNEFVSAVSAGIKAVCIE